MGRRLLALSFVLLCVWTPVRADQVVLGKLGQAVGSTPIHASSSTRSRIYYRLQPYEYIIIRPSNKEGWLRVVLQNGRLGWVKAEVVARLPYDVTASQVQQGSNAGTGLAASGDLRTRLAGYSLNYVGTPYVWGGNDMQNGVDCSGFVKNLYGKIGINLPRTAAQQALVGQPILNKQDLAAGDRLYFWDKRRGKIGHTGMYLGNGWFVHSSSSRRGVATDNIMDPKWDRILVAARR